MSKRTTTILLIIGIPLSFFAGLKCQQTLSKIDGIGEPLLTTVEFKNNRLRDTLYLVTKRWGYTGDHQVFALTKSKPENNHWQPDTSKDLIWKGENTIFYKQENDSIKIFSLQLPDKTQELETKQVIKVTQINGQLFKDFRKQVDTAIKLIE